MVAEYNAEELANDSENNKRLEEVEKSEEWKESREAEEKACRARCSQTGHTLCVQST